MNLTQSSEQAQAGALAYACTWDQSEGWEISKLLNMFVVLGKLSSVFPCLFPFMK